MVAFNQFVSSYDIVMCDVLSKFKSELHLR